MSFRTNQSDEEKRTETKTMQLFSTVDVIQISHRKC